MVGMVGKGAELRRVSGLISLNAHGRGSVLGIPGDGHPKRDWANLYFIGIAEMCFLDGLAIEQGFVLGVAAQEHPLDDSRPPHLELVIPTRGRAQQTHQDEVSQ